MAAAAALMLLGCTGKPAPQTIQVSAASTVNPSGVGCIGRVEPEGGIIVVAASPALGRSPLIAQILVQEGQQVDPGQAIAVLDSLPDLQSAVKQADARVAVAQSRLAQLQAGARTGDILVLKTEVARLETESNAARQALAREEALGRKDFVPRVQVDAARLKSENTDRLLEAARHRLESMTDVRESDFSLAKAEVAAAGADRERATVELRAGTIRSHVKARVIQILARPGEAVGLRGVITLADTSRMNVIGEVYETDIARVHTGQKAVISSESLPKPVDGVVVWISPQIESLNVPVDPSAPADQRVYQVRIRVNNPEELAQRIHSKVNVSIEP